MIKIEKPATVPEALKAQNILDKFQEYAQDREYGKSTLYKNVQEDLQEIYHDKCAYCEDKLLNNFRPVEHYRPKKLKSSSKCDASFAYYWLGFSWDNLLLACSFCNGQKGNCFDIGGERVNYDGESLEDLHTKARDYFDREKPLLINPELENPEPYLIFKDSGEVLSKKQELRYTIRICNLNREDLITKRRKILTDFQHRLEGALYSFQKFSKVGFEMRIEYFRNPIQFFVKKVEDSESFTAWRRYILNHFETYIETHSSLNQNQKMVLKLAWKKFSS